MKTLYITGYAMLTVAGLCGATPEGPEPYPVQRYEPLMSRSAFSPATEGLPAVLSADFAKDLVVTGVVRLNGGEFVTIASRDQKRQFGLSRDEVREGISIAGVAWSDRQGQTRVTLKRGGEYAVIGFDEAAAAGPKTENPAAVVPSEPTNPGKPPLSSQQESQPSAIPNAAPRNIMP